MAAAAGAGAGARPPVTGAQAIDRTLGHGLTQGTFPYKHLDDRNGLLFDLPQRQVTYLKDPKQIRFFHAVTRILTTAQLNSKSGKRCAQYEADVAAGKEALSKACRGQKPHPMQVNQLVAGLNVTLFRDLGADVNQETEKVALEFVMNDLRATFGQKSEAQLLAQAKSVILTQGIQSWCMMHADTVVEKLMVNRFGLKPLSYQQFATQEGVQTTLRAKGPFIIFGAFGLVAPSQEKTPFLVTNTHPIVVTGLKFEPNGACTVCWVNPNDHGSANEPPKVFETAFATFVDQIGMTGSQYNPAFKEMLSKAYYNPLFSYKPLEFYDINPVYQTLGRYGLTKEVGREVLDFCGIEPEHPCLLFYDINRVVYEMPRGKVNKEGQAVLQEPQKGPTCFFYALKRLLTRGQVDSPHGRDGSERRKAFTVIDLRLPLDELFQKMEVANHVFLRKRGLKPEEASQNCDQIYMSNMNGSPVVMAKIMAFNDKKEVAKPNENHLRSSKANCLADEQLVQGHGLEGVPYDEFQTIEKLLDVLKAKGPLLVGGIFGYGVYRTAPTKLTATLGERPLYGWLKGATVHISDIFRHAVVIVGAEATRAGNFVYWVDPVDGSDPKDWQMQRVFKGSFDNFIVRLAIGDVAYCNPLFAAKN